MAIEHYEVGWSRTAHRTLEKLFNIDPVQVFH